MSTREYDEKLEKLRLRIENDLRDLPMMAKIAR